MLLYHNGNFFRQLLQGSGSAFWKKETLALGFVMAMVTAGLQLLHNMGHDFATIDAHAYPIQALGGFVTLALVFRINQAWKRYWEAVTQLYYMYSKWADAYSQFCGFMSVTILKTEEEKSGDELDNKMKLLRDMHEKVENDFLLLSAMACDRICRGDCARMERREELRVRWADRIVLREDLRTGKDVTNGTAMPTFARRQNSNSFDVQAHNMRASEARESSSSSNSYDSQGYWDAEYLVSKLPSGPKFELLKNSHDRANMVVNWLNHNLAFCANHLTIPPPIQSRMFQEISNGMLGFNNALKVADVPLPFPYSQITVICMLIWFCWIPFYIVAFTHSLVAGPTSAFLLSAFAFSMNHIAQEIEVPYGRGANKVFVPEFHSRFLLVIRDATRSSFNPPRPPRTTMKDPEAPSKRISVNLEFVEESDDDEEGSLACDSVAALRPSVTWKSSADAQFKPCDDLSEMPPPRPTPVRAYDASTVVANMENLRQLCEPLPVVGGTAVEILYQCLTAATARVEQHLHTISQQLQQMSNASGLLQKDLSSGNEAFNIAANPTADCGNFGEHALQCKIGTCPSSKSSATIAVASVVKNERHEEVKLPCAPAAQI